MKECAMTACSQMVEPPNDYCHRHIALCVIPGCEQHNRTMGMCNTHYSNYLRKRKRADCHALCVMPNCYETKESEGFCAYHYQMKLLYRKPYPCVTPMCQEMAVNEGHCEEHYQILKRTGAPVQRIMLCGVPGCRKPFESKGMCKRHYTQWIRSTEKYLEEEPT